MLIINTSLFIYYYPIISAVLGIILSVIGILFLGNNPIYFYKYNKLSEDIYLFLVIFFVVCLVNLYYKLYMYVIDLLNPAQECSSYNEPGGYGPSGGNRPSGGGGTGPSAKEKRR